jgi:predicted lipoprotein with Yx(FWY)xxD motif
MTRPAFLPLPVASLLGALVVACSLPATALAQPRVADGVLVDDAGMSLYVWDNDLTAPGKSVCTGVCTVLWPPYRGAEGARPVGDYTLLPRDDGAPQWMWKGRPLYRFSNDQKPGDRTGDGMRGGIWHLARP